MEISMESSMREALPPIPAKRYFTIGEVSELCGVKPYVLRYWEQEFTQLKPMKRRGNRRYYQHHEVLLIRRIRELLYDQGFTIIGARNRLGDAAARPAPGDDEDDANADEGAGAELPAGDAATVSVRAARAPSAAAALDPSQLRAELMSIRELLSA
jgi:DNA-binding transcriptional MerR regulator